MKRQKPPKESGAMASPAPAKKPNTNQGETDTGTSLVSVPTRAESGIMKMSESEAQIFDKSSEMMRKFAEDSKEEMRRVREQKDILDLREKMKAEQKQGPGRGPQ